MKRFEVFNKITIQNALKQGFSPKCFRDFNNLDEAKTYVRDFYKNTGGRIEDLVVCEVNYTPVFEITHTVTSLVKDL